MTCYRGGGPYEGFENAERWLRVAAVAFGEVFMGLNFMIGRDR